MAGGPNSIQYSAARLNKQNRGVSTANSPRIPKYSVRIPTRLKLKIHEYNFNSFFVPLILIKNVISIFLSYKDRFPENKTL